MIAAFMVAMGANAQAIRIAKNTEMYNPTVVKMENVMKKEFKAFAGIKTPKQVTRRAGETGLDGEYILNSDNYEGSFTASSSFTIESGTGTITLDMYAEEGQAAPEFQYNVVLKDFTYTGGVAYGNYNAEEGYIEIPMQTIAVHPTYKEIVLSGGYRADDDKVGYGKEIILMVNDDGSMDIYGDVEEEGDMETTGFVSFIPNYETPSLWSTGFDIMVLVPNATLNYNTTAKSLGGTGSGWSKVSKRVAVEDYGSEILVNNFLGLCPISVSVDAQAGTCNIPLGQYVDDYDYEKKYPEFPYGCLRLVGCVIEGQSIGRDYTKTALNGFISEDGLEYDFFKIEYKEAWTDTDGEHEAGYYYVDDDPNYVRYIAVATAADGEGAAIGMGWCCNIWFEIDSEDPSGIAEMKANTKNATVKTYNLMGQEVGANAKGLVIRDGKKMLVK